MWHHAAATYDGTTWRLYLDGNLDRTLALAGSLAPESDSIQHAGLGTAMTSTGSAAGFFAGAMDEARIWNYARSQAEIQATMNQALASGTGLIGRWGMNEGTGTSTADSTTPTENGTLTNGPTWVTGLNFGDITPPAAPTDLTATGGIGQVSLAWTANGEADIAGYNVYRSLGSPVPLGDSGQRDPAPLPRLCGHRVRRRHSLLLCGDRGRRRRQRVRALRPRPRPPRTFRMP